MRKIVWLLVIGLLFTGSCNAQKRARKKAKVAYNQGVEGTVTWLAGNQMPSPDQPQRPEAKGTPIMREIWIYELTDNTKVEADAEGFYKKINTKFIKKIKTDSVGRFKIDLPLGYYSLFTKEEKGLWANVFDDANNINPVQIQSKRYAKINITINYQASF